VTHELNSIMENAALPQQMPDGSLAPTLTVSQIEELAVRLGTDGKTVEIAALERGIYPQRYARNFNTYQPRDQIRLLKSKVTVVGLGGLGGIVTEWLTRAGVGLMRLVDGDRFEHHNLNRQVLCTQHRIGTSKAKAAAERVCSINSSISVEAHAEFMNPGNASRLISDSDVVVDCLDNINSRFVLESAAKESAVPMVSAAVAGLSGQVTTIYPQDRGLELIYGPKERLGSCKGAEQTLGCLPQAVGLIAAAESAEVTKVLLGQDNRLLRNQMLLVDMATNTFEILELI
jgi:molybdopterin/thiamine biosynthesis adenylyltransferase